MHLMTLLSTSAIVLSSLTSAVSIIDYTKLPACAKQCSVLAAAEGGCVPPAAPVTTQDIYQSCFCQSALLTTLKTTPSLCSAAVANSGCSDADATKIEQYYVALCNGPTVQPPHTTTTTATTATTATSSTGIATGTGISKGVNSSNNGSWFSTHWKWVLMLIIIFLFMIIASVLGVYLKRRHARRADARRANLAAHDAPVTNAAFHDHFAKEISGVLPTPPQVRTRSGTVTSRASSSRLSKHRVSEPVVWGPHQHASTWSEDGAQQQDFQQDLQQVRSPRGYGRPVHEQMGEAEASKLKEVKL